jgi:hypothetical protein
MVNNDDDTELKIVDFGLSKIIGPNETSLDPFGTLVYLYSIFIYFSLMLHQKFCYKNLMVKKLIFGH